MKEEIKKIKSEYFKKFDEITKEKNDKLKELLNNVINKLNRQYINKYFKYLDYYFIPKKFYVEWRNESDPRIEINIVKGFKSSRKDHIFILPSISEYTITIFNLEDIVDSVTEISEKEYYKKLYSISEIILKDRTYIDISFFYRQELYIERIYTDEINKGEIKWTKEFQNGPKDNYPDLWFEIIGDLNEKGQFTTDNLIILVNNGDKINEIGYRKSWTENKAFR